MQQIQEIIIGGSMSILTILAGIIVHAVKSWLVTKGGTNAVKIVEILAKNAVNAVEQINKETDLKGEEKLNQAKKYIVQELEKYNVYMSDKDLDMFVELLNSAASLGYEVEYNEVGNVNSKPRASAVFVMYTTYIYGHEYGHTGVVIEDSDGYTMRTIEQNIDGNADSLYIGGPARYNTRNFDGVVGWFYFPTDDTGYQPAPSTPSGDGSINEETGIFTVEVSALNVRASAGLSAEIVAVYTAGQEINYDGWCDKDGYIWVTYIGGSGNRRYVAVGQSENGRRVTSFGSFR